MHIYCIYIICVPIDIILEYGAMYRNVKAQEHIDTNLLQLLRFRPNSQSCIQKGN